MHLVLVSVRDATRSINKADELHRLSCSVTISEYSRIFTGAHTSILSAVLARRMARRAIAGLSACHALKHVQDTHAPAGSHVLKHVQDAHAPAGSQLGHP